MLYRYHQLLKTLRCRGDDKIFCSAGGFLPLVCGHDLPLVVVGVVLYPVEGDGSRQHRVRDGERLSEGERMRPQLLTHLDGRRLDVGHLVGGHQPQDQHVAQVLLDSGDAVQGKQLGQHRLQRAVQVTFVDFEQEPEISSEQICKKRKKLVS